MRKWTYLFIYYLSAYVISLYHLNHCFLISFEIYKQEPQRKLNIASNVILRRWNIASL